MKNIQYNTSDKFTKYEGKILAVSKNKLDIWDKNLQQLEHIKFRIPLGYRVFIKNIEVSRYVYRKSSK